MCRLTIFEDPKITGSYISNVSGAFEQQEIPAPVPLSTDIVDEQDAAEDRIRLVEPNR